MIVHDLATLGPDLIRNAVLVAGATAGLGAALFALAVFLIASAITGMWQPRNAPAPTDDYEEAA